MSEKCFSVRLTQWVIVKTDRIRWMVEVLWHFGHASIGYIMPEEV